MPDCLTPPAESAMIPVSVATLIPATVPGVSLYLPAGNGLRPQLYRGADFPVTQADIDQLQDRGVGTLYVAVGEHGAYQQYLREHLEPLLDDESVPIARRMGCLNEVVRDVLAGVFRKGNLDDCIDELRHLGARTVQVICRDDVLLSDLRGVLHHDYHTFTHSANVAYYCVMLATRMGMRDEQELTALATGALLHDAGKLDVPAGLLTKPGRLDDDELRIVRRHPTAGYRRLCRRNDLSRAQLMMVYQHHERVDGDGYPARSPGRDIDDWAKICAVADVFEALTSNRPYRMGLSIPAACATMEAGSGTHFDPEILACWKQIVSNR
jgi:HD-GYP domain-containing protein (c-di-GMP phosphodiesterase class II)